MREFIFGKRDPKTLVGPATTEVDLSIEDDLQLEGVQLHYVIIETTADSARASVPPSLHSTAPGLVSIHFWNVKESPAGPFTLAMVGIVARTNFKPRHFIVSAYVSSEAARKLIAPRCGFPLQVAELEQAEFNDAVVSSVTLDGETLIDVSTHETQMILGSAAALKISPLLAVGKVGGDACIIQCETSYEFKTTRRGKPKIHAFAAKALGLPDVKLGMPPLSAHSVVDISLHPLRFSLDLAEPAEKVGSTRLRETA